jgi:chromosome segregation ATPase
MDPVIGVIIAAMLGAMGSYLAVARKLSGKINTSDATELWNESRSIREWSADRIATLTSQVSELEHRVEVVEGYNLTLVTEKQKLLERIQELQTELVASRNTTAILTRQLNQADDHIEKLEQDIRALEGKRRREVDEPNGE